MKDAVSTPDLAPDCLEKPIVPQARESKKPRVLMVDDDPMILAMLAITIRKAGYDVLQAHSAEQALELIAADRPDLAVLDISMPGMSGIELAQRLRKETEIPFMFLSSHADADTVRRATKCGAVGYLVKPIHPMQVVPAIEIGLARADEIRQSRRQPKTLPAAPAVGQEAEEETSTCSGQAEVEWMARYAELTELSMRLEQMQEQLAHTQPAGFATQHLTGATPGDGLPVVHVRARIKALERQVNDLLCILDAYDSTEASLAVEEQARAELKQIVDEIRALFFSVDINALYKQFSEGIRRVRKITDALRDFSGMNGSAGRRSVDLHAGLDAALELVRDEIGYKAAVLKAYGDIPEIECCPIQMNRVFVNLIANAAHAIKEQGRITLSTGASDDCVWVEISDNGCGIPPENQKIVFTPFFSTRPAGIGAGLGLSVASEIVHQHHGDILVTSEVGEGTTFRVTLPQRQSASGMSAPTQGSF